MNLSPEPFLITEKLGCAYSSALVPVPFAAETHSAVDQNGHAYPVQSAPRLATDPEGDGPVNLVLIDAEPWESLSLTPLNEPAGSNAAFRVDDIPGGRLVSNGSLCVRIPESGLWADNAPGPFSGFRIGGSHEIGKSVLRGAVGCIRITTEIESAGAALAQWRVSYRWGSASGCDVRVRWASGADTLVVQEDCLRDSDAAIEILPLAAHRATAFHKGAGERLGPLEEMACDYPDGVGKLPGRRALGHLSHISYFSQWRSSWVGFASDGAPEMVGAFSGWSTRWRRRGRVRPEIVEDEDAGALLRLPIREGRRVWGLVLSTRAEVEFGAGEKRHLLNVRKTQFADIPLAKQMNWQLDAPIEERRLKLTPPDSLATFRERLARDNEIPEALENFLRRSDPAAPGFSAAAIWKNDPALMAACVPALRCMADRCLADLCDGGYDRICIFHGRESKRLAYDLDALYALDMVADDDYRAIRRGFLALAYVFADPDYCRYEDFFMELDPPEEGVLDAMSDEMGDSPVPPNFAAEFFTTTAVMAELFDRHPMHGAWRSFADKMLARFLNRWFEPDGSYLESVNYQNHCMNELLCQMLPAIWTGRIDYASDPRVRGSFEHFLAIRMPVLSTRLWKPEKPIPLFASQDMSRLSPLPADGNSGNHGDEQRWNAQLSVGAWIYAPRDPDFASALMTAWRESGKLIVDYEHPVFTLATLDPAIPSRQPAIGSARRKSLGIVSRGMLASGEPVWSLFRAGRATHHMDFDQGNLHIAAADVVLLGDHGYHTTDRDGAEIGGGATWLHNTITYGRDRNNSSGYTGLERAPEPEFVSLGENFDYVVHRMVTTNLRRLDRTSYNRLFPLDPQAHVRHMLFVKSGYWVIWDVFEQGSEPTTFWLHPTMPAAPLGDGGFRAGDAGTLGLTIRFAQPAALDVLENCQSGPLWSLAIRQPAALPYLAVIAVTRSAEGLAARYEESNRRLAVSHEGVEDVIVLPPAGARERPAILRDGDRTALK